MKKDLLDVTFVFYVRPDSIVRIENLIVCVSFIRENFKTNIKVLETASYNNGIISKLLGDGIDYCFIEDKDPIFYRTKYFNLLTKKVQTPYLGLWDADTIIDQPQVMDAIKPLRENQADVALPYNGSMLETSEAIRSLFLIKKDINILHRNVNKMNLLYGTRMNGAAVLINLEKYKEAGKECSDYYGWGNEDYDRFVRYEKLNYRIFKTDGCLYHLSHPRDENGKFRNYEQFRKSMDVLNRKRKSTPSELLTSL